MTTEPKINLNGVDLSEREAGVLRMALEAFEADMSGQKAAIFLGAGTAAQNAKTARAFANALFNARYEQVR